MSILFSFAFFIIATLYSIVGFGGGTSYIALLIAFNISYQTAPILALTCNLLVVTGNTINFIRNKNLHWRLVWPFIISSVPLAYLGGRTPISKTHFQLILGLMLLAAGIRMFLNKKDRDYSSRNTKPNVYVSLGIGGVLGYVSGLVGLGGGIFLAPIMYTLRWGQPKQVAATASFFILVNSIFGLLGQLQKQNFSGEFLNYWYLFIAVIIGGQLGSHLCNLKISQRVIELMTATLISIVSTKLLYNVILIYFT